MSQFINHLLKATDYNEYHQIMTNARADENKFRSIFANPLSDPQSSCLTDLYCMLYPIYENDNSKNMKYRELFRDESEIPKVFPLKNRRQPQDQCISTYEQFRSNFDILTEGMFRNINWDNIIIAGGSVSACLRPVPAEYNTREKMSKYFHEISYPGVDVDLFMYGLNEDDAKKKMVELSVALQDQIIFPIKYFRTTHSITIVSKFPYINCQIILRIYKSPAEVIMGFDIDSCAVLYNGKQVYCLPRSFNSLISQYNTVDMTRRSPTYETRLAKYASRGYEILVPTLDRNKINPNIYEKPLSKLVGLPRLLLLEKFRDPDSRLKYLSEKAQLRGRGLSQLMKRVIETSFSKGDILDLGERINDYSIVFFPFGPKWDSHTISDLLKRKDKLLNQSFYTGEDRNYHTHPCFISDSIEDVFKSCCQNCPDFPDDLRHELKDKFVRGELVFLQDNPGQQLVGSFHPITEGHWSAGTYGDEHTDELMTLCTQDNIDNLNEFINKYTVDIDNSDSLDRLPIHISAYTNNITVLKFLLDRKINISKTMIDGRSAFHIASLYGHHDYLQALLEYNSTLDDDLKYNINAADNVYHLTSLDYSTMFLHPKCVELLLKYGANPRSTLSRKTEVPNLPTICLSAFLSSAYPDRCKEVLSYYLEKQINSHHIYLQEDNSYVTVFHYSLLNGYTEHVKAWLEIDKSAHDHLNMLYRGKNILEIPIKNNNFALFKLLIDSGASFNNTQTQIDNYIRWVRKFPALDNGEIVDLKLANIHSPLESILERLVSNDEHADAPMEMILYALNIDTVIDTKTRNISFCGRLNSVMESYIRKLNCLKGVGMKRNVRQICLSESDLNMLRESNLPYPTFIIDTIDAYNSKVNKDNDEIAMIYSNIHMLDTIFELLVRSEIISPSDKRNFSSITPDCELSMFQTMVPPNNKSSGEYIYLPVPDCDKQRYVEFYNAVFTNDVETVLNLTDVALEDPVLVSSLCPLGMNPILLCVYKGYDELLKLLVEIAIKQYTPIRIKEIRDDKRLNNNDIVNGTIDDSPKVIDVLDQTTNFETIISQISHVDILLHFFAFPCNVLLTNQFATSHLVSVNSLTLSIDMKRYEIIKYIIDTVISSDKTMAEKRRREIKYTDSGLYILTTMELKTICPTTPAGCNLLSQSSLLTKCISCNDIEIMKIFARKLGLCQTILDPNDEEKGLIPFIYYVCAFGDEKTLQYCLSPELVVNVNDFQTINPFAKIWEKFGVMEQLDNQLSATFGRDEVIPDYLKIQPIYYKPLLYYASIYRNHKTVEYILSLDKDIDKKILTICLEETSHVDDLETIRTLFTSGGAITLKFLRRCIDQIGDNTDNQLVDNYNTILGMIPDDRKPELFQEDRCYMLTVAFTRNRTDLVQLLLSHSYSLKSLNQFFQSILHINSSSIDFYKKIGIVNDLNANEEFTQLFSTEDGHGDIPIDIYKSVFIKTAISKGPKNDFDPKGVSHLMEKMTASILTRILIPSTTVSLTIQNYDPILNRFRENNVKTDIQKAEPKNIHTSPSPSRSPRSP